MPGGRAYTRTGYQDPATRAAKLQRNLRLLWLDQADRPNDPFTLFNLGLAYCEMGRFADALPLVERFWGEKLPFQQS